MGTAQCLGVPCGNLLNVTLMFRPCPVYLYAHPLRHMCIQGSEKLSFCETCSPQSNFPIVVPLKPDALKRCRILQFTTATRFVTIFSSRRHSSALSVQLYTFVFFSLPSVSFAVTFAAVKKTNVERIIAACG